MDRIRTLETDNKKPDKENQGQGLKLKIPGNFNNSTKSPGTAEITPTTKFLRSLGEKDERRKMEPTEVKRYSQQSTDISPGIPETPVAYESLDSDERFKSGELTNIFRLPVVIPLR